MSLVQVGSDIWVDPRHIMGVRHMDGWKSYTGEEHPPYTQVIYETSGLFGLSTVYLTSDWPFDQVRKALGLTSVADVEGIVDGGAR